MWPCILAVYYKEELKERTDHNETNINLTKLVSEDLDVIGIYRRQEGSERILLEKLIRLLGEYIELAIYKYMRI